MPATDSVLSLLPSLGQPVAKVTHLHNSWFKSSVPKVPQKESGAKKAAKRKVAAQSVGLALTLANFRFFLCYLICKFGSDNSVTSPTQFEKSGDVANCAKEWVSLC